MSDVHAVTTEPLTNRQIVRREASTPGRVTGKLRTACDALIFDGLELDQAATAAGISTRRLRLALEKRHVIAYLKAQRQVLRESISGRNILALKDVRDQTDNQMARVQAVKVLEQMDDITQASGSKAQSPGFTIIIAAPAFIGHEQQPQSNQQLTQAGMTDRAGSVTIEHAPAHNPPSGDEAEGEGKNR